MAKKNGEFDLDEFNFDDFAEFEEFDLGDPSQPSNDREPVLKKLGKATVDGAVAAAKEPVFVKNFLRAALPKGYSDAIDLADTTLNEGRTLYNRAAAELKQPVRDLRKAAGKILPKYEKSLPPKLFEKLRNLTNVEDEQDWRNQASQDNEITAELGKIFEAKAEQDQYNAEKQEVTQAIREKENANRTNSMIEVLRGIHQLTSRQVGYQDSITAKYQRKNLELQYRQVFALQELVNSGKVTDKTMLEELAAIRKNSGLPDFAKITTSEAGKQFMRERLFGTMTESFNNYSQNFSKRLVDNITRKAMEKVTAFGSALSQAAQGLEMVGTAGEMSGGQFGATDFMGSLAGGEVAEYLGAKLGGGLRKVTSKNEGVNKFGADLSNLVRNGKYMANAYAKSDTDYMSRWAGLENLIKSVIPTSYGVTGSVDNAGVRGLNKEAAFDSMFYRSVTEVMPGYLARLLQEIQALRTGSMPERTVYNWDRNEFAGYKQTGADIMARVIPKRDIDSVSQGLQEFIGKVDPEGKLSKEAKSALAQSLFKNMAANDHFDPQTQFSGKYLDGKTSPEVKAELQQLLGQRYSIGADGKMASTSAAKLLRNQDAERLESLRRVIPDINETLNSYANTGQREFLRDSGLLYKRGTEDLVNSSFLWDRFNESLNNTAGASGERGPSDHRQDGGPGYRPFGPFGGGTGGSGFRDADPSVAGPELGDSFVERLIEAANSNTNRTIEAIKPKANEETLVGAVETLQEILVALQNGQLANGGGGAPSAGSGGFWRRSGRRARRYSKALLGAMGKLQMAQIRGVGGILGGMGKAVGGAFGRAGDWLSRKKEVMDVYIKGQVEPAIRAHLLAAGEYRDALTGEVIRKMEDIKGAVIDKDGNIVISFDDIKKGLFDVYGKKIGGTRLGKMLEGAFDLGKRAFGGVVSLQTLPFRAAWKMAKSGANFLRTPSDVYVLGEDRPRLYSRLIAQGYYISVKSKKRIKHYSDIDGPVVDKYGNSVLSEEDFQKGLVDATGDRLESVVSKAWSGVKKLGSLAKRGLNHAVELGKSAWGLAGRVAKAPLEFFRGKAGLSSERSGRGDSWTKRIYKLLDERLPGGRRRRSRFDQDGDGLREGSWQEILRNRAKAASEKMKGKKGDDIKAAKEKGGGVMGLLLTVLAGIRSKLAEFNPKALLETFLKAKAAKDGADMLGDAADLAGGRGRGKRGWLRRAGSALGRGARGAWKWGARVGLGLLGSGTGSAAASAASGAAATAASSAAAGATSAGFGGMLATAAGGVLSFLTSPVVLGVAATAALAYGGYKAYKYFTRPGPLQVLKALQYGIDPKNEEAMERVANLEQMCLPAVRRQGTQPVTEMSAIDPQPMYELFGLDLRNRDQIGSFQAWFAQRFKPVFFQHLTLLQRYAPQRGIDELDKIDDSIKARYARESVLGGLPSPYDCYSSPFPDMERLPTGRQSIDAQVAEIVKQFGDKAKDTVLESGSRPGTVRPSFGPTLSQAARSPTPQNYRSGTSYVDNSRVEKEKETKIKAGDFSFVEGQNRTLDDLAGVRMRAYGLVNLEVDAVNALLRMEQELEDQVEIGWFGGTSISIRPEEALRKYGPLFQLSTQDPAAAAQWQFWFEHRFCPVLLAFVKALRNANKNASVKDAYITLSGKDRLAVAQAILAATTTVQGREMSVWLVEAGPYTNRPVNTDSGSAKAAMDSLRAKQKNPVMSEAPKKTDSEGQAVGFFQRMRNSIADMWAGPKAPVGGGINMGGGSGYGASRPNGDSAGLGGSGYGPGTGPIDMSGGNVAKHPGQGTGGDINSLPMPKGDGWENVRDLIVSASKMVGVDPGLMATMASIESNFKISARPKKGSATGLYQFIDDTWKGMLARYGAKYGIAPNTPPTDPRANALMGAEYIRENQQYLQKKLGRQVTDNDLYMAHFLGPGGAVAMLQADATQSAASAVARTNPNAPAYNPTIFYDNNRPKTVGEFYQWVNQKVSSHGKRYGSNAAELAATGSAPVIPESKTPPASIAKPGDKPLAGSGTAGVDIPQGPPPKDAGLQPASTTPVLFQGPTVGAVSTPTAPPVSSPMGEPGSQVAQALEQRDQTVRQTQQVQQAQVQAQAREQAAQQQQQVVKDETVRKLLDDQLVELRLTNKTLDKILSAIQSKTEETPDPSKPAPAQATRSRTLDNQKNDSMVSMQRKY